MNYSIIFTEISFSPETSNLFTCGCIFDILLQENSNSLSGTLAFFRYRKNPNSCGCKISRACPTPPCPRAVLPTLWMYSYKKINIGTSRYKTEKIYVKASLLRVLKSCKQQYDLHDQGQDHKFLSNFMINPWAKAVNKLNLLLCLQNLQSILNDLDVWNMYKCSNNSSCKYFFN